MRDDQKASRGAIQTSLSLVSAASEVTKNIRTWLGFVQGGFVQTRGCSSKEGLGNQQRRPHGRDRDTEEVMEIEALILKEARQIIVGRCRRGDGNQFRCDMVCGSGSIQTCKETAFDKLEKLLVGNTGPRPRG